MKISKEKDYAVDGQVDYMSLINDLQDEHDAIYWHTIGGQMFIYRPLGRLEYRQVLSADISDIEKEDAVCQACLLYPIGFDFDDCLAGIPTELFKQILKNSFLDSIESKKLVVAYHRKEMEQFDNQITCIINEAFPNYDIEDIENWDMAKTAKYLSRAEWKLNVLRQIPIDYEVSDQLMEHEWQVQHSDNIEKPKEQPQIQMQTKEQPVQTEFKVETLEERQARIAKEGPRKKSPEELARLKAMFPEIDWGAEIDPSLNIDNMKDTLDVASPALRAGW